jgi:hypothetical protein
MQRVEHHDNSTYEPKDIKQKETASCEKEHESLKKIVLTEIHLLNPVNEFVTDPNDKMYRNRLPKTEHEETNGEGQGLFSPYNYVFDNKNY